MSFQEINDENELLIRNIKQLYKRWEDLYSFSNTKNTEELNYIKHQIDTELNSLEENLTQKNDFILSLEMNFENYTLNSQELQPQKKFIQNGFEFIHKIQHKMSNQITNKIRDENKKNKILSIQDKPALMNGKKVKIIGFEEEIIQKQNQNQNENENQTGNQVQEKILLEQQNKTLEDLSQRIQNIGDRGLQISDELSQQISLINDYDNETAAVNEKMIRVNKTLSKFIYGNPCCCKFCLISFLLILLGLFLLLIFLFK
ncbi:syntaxin-61 [Anaeramoeba ignava]|uniref:Syntaxin-61 n=1 Tax=Anaeramoeba ignava TaxID=1746090 RepID=A0A9Q0LET7_ANAIG|nr:syntaxin-61 [Anaeramoeba ignava]